MKILVPRCLRVAVLLCLFLFPSSARAIIVIGDVTNPNDPGQIYTPAPNNLESYIGWLGGVVEATPISPTYFVTVGHAGNTYTSFTYSNNTATSTTYPVQQVATQGDLALWRIAPTSALTFSYYAPVYTNPTIIGQPLITIGYGLTRGDPIISSNPQYGIQGVPGVPNGLQGWQAVPYPQGMSWGTNTVADRLSFPAYGNFLYFTFDYNPNNPNNATTAIYASGDSGGPTFVLDPSDNTWKLAGINSLVDSVNDVHGNEVLAAIFDARGYYYYDSNNNLVQITGDVPVPLGSYAVDIQSNIDWLLGEGVPINVPEPSSLMLTGLVAVGVAVRYWRRSVLPTRGA